MASRATMIADALRKKAPDAPDVFSAPKQSWADYVGAQPATGYEGMPAPQAEGMPEHDPNGTVSRIAGALATMPTVQAIKSGLTLPGDVYAGRQPMGLPSETEDLSRVADLAGLAMTGGVAGTGTGGMALGAGPLRRTPGLPMDEAARMARAAELGYEGPWYHGSARTDRLVEGGKIDPKRATSGPMPFFTDDPARASNYATSKADTSLIKSDPGDSVANYFTVSPKDLGIGGRTQIPVERTWPYLPPEVKADILEKAKRIGYQNIDQGEGPFTLHPPGTDASISGSQYDYIMKTSARGNPLAALRELWHDSGAIFNSEKDLAEIYRLAGYPAPISQVNAPWTEAAGVLPAMLRMKNPLDTTNAATLKESVLPALETAFKRDRSRINQYDAADMWDKHSRWTPREWVQQLKADVESGTNSMVFTSIPDKVTAELKRLGYDGILDKGGKMGGEGHTVAIPFEPDQVRSRFARFDPANQGTGMLLGSGATDKPSAAMLGQALLGNREPIRAYHGSPQTSLTELLPSERGPFGPGVYLSPAEQVAQRYARGGKVYEKDIDSGAIFQGTKPRDSSINPYDTWREQSAKLVEAAEPEMKQAVAELASRMDPSDGYPFYVRLAQLYKSDAGAQGLLKRAGYKGISGHVDGPEIAHFDPLQVGIKAYHGSPHDFDKFDLSKIGTGEGAQAYGHGLYFAEKEGTAKAYREGLAGPPKGLTGKLDGAEDWYNAAPADRAGMNELWGRISPYQIKTPEDAARILARAKGDLERTIVNVEGGHIKVHPGDEEGYRQALRLLNEGRVTFDPPHTPGRMYEVAIHADPERFLDWDQPLSGQPGIADTLLDRLPKGHEYKNFPDQRPKMTGAEAYRGIGQGDPRLLGDIPDYQNAVRATDALRDAGIPGIKYLDQGSRNLQILSPKETVHGEWVVKQIPNGNVYYRGPDEAAARAAYGNGGSRNYVLFDDKIVEILRKYGVGSIAALPPAVQMAIQLHQDQAETQPQEPTFAGKASKMIDNLQRKLRGPEPPATPLGMGIRG